MKSRPVVESGLIAVLFLLAAVPLWYLTRPVAAMETSSKEVSEGRECYLRLRFSHFPVLVRIKNLEEEVLFEAEKPEDELETDLVMSGPVMLEIEWSGSVTRAAVEVMLEPEDKESMVKTFWSEGPMREVLELP